MSRRGGGTTHSRAAAERRLRNDAANVDDDAPNLAAALPEVPGFKEKMNETTKLAMTDRCRRDYRSRLVRIAEWFRLNDPEYFAVGVREVSEGELWPMKRCTTSMVHTRSI